MKEHGAQCPRGCHPGQPFDTPISAVAANIRQSKKYIADMYGDNDDADSCEPETLADIVSTQRDPDASLILTEAFNELGRSAGKANDVPEVSPRESALLEAAGLVTGDRNSAYGPPTQDFDRTAAALTAMGYRRLDPRADEHTVANQNTTLPLYPHDVAIMVMMVKISRLMSTPQKRDSWVDIAGYAGCGYECTTEEGR